MYLPLLLLAGGLGSACSVDLEAGVASAGGRFERELTTDGAVDLDVRTGSGSIDIRRGSGNEVRIVGNIRAHRGFWNSSSAEERVRRIEANPPVSQNGNSIRVGEFEERDLSRNVSISYEILVPARTSVRSRTGSGGHRIESLDGRVDAETGSGSIRLGRIGGPVVASTGSGSIEVAGAGGLTARTGSGSIDATGIVGGVRANTGSGGVNIEGSPTTDWTVRTGSGSIGLRLPNDAGFNLDARTGSGSIDTRHPVELRGSISRRHMQGRVRGGGPRIDASAGSGSIRLE
jgi:DUF4097 and DUF4098 domain-containing protein YvlB